MKKEEGAPNYSSRIWLNWTKNLPYDQRFDALVEIAASLDSVDVLKVINNQLAHSIDCLEGPQSWEGELAEVEIALGNRRNQSNTTKLAQEKIQQAIEYLRSIEGSKS